MDRRTAITAAVGAVAGVFIAGGEPSKKLRTIRRWSGEKWEVVRLAEIRQGDLFMADDLKVQQIACKDADYERGVARVICQSAYAPKVYDVPA